MKLFLTSAYSMHSGLDTLCRIASIDSVGHHERCTNPEEADAILFVENTQFDDVLFNQLLHHPLLGQYPDKVFMYNEMDRPWHVLPGLYCCMTRHQIDPSQHRAFAYLSTPNPYISNIFQKPVERKWLYSFMGSMSHSCRRPIVRFQDPNGFVQDTSDFNVWHSSEQELEIRGKRYAEVLAASDFVLCPRGIGTSSIRLYETLEAGRVPVIISDQWIAPSEADWSFAIQVEQRRVSSIPGLLKTLANEAVDRGTAARAAWEQHYAPNTLFNTVCDSVESLLQNNRSSHLKPSVDLRKWLVTGELLTRSAAQRLKGFH